MGEIRVMKIKEKLKECTAEVVIVSAFEDKKKFRKFSDDIAWESEVWIAEDSDHMVHFNGIKFLDIHKNVRFSLLLFRWQPSLTSKPTRSSRLN